MLNDSFRINYPYGIVRNDKGEWMAFNRDYMPLGYRGGEFGIGVNYINAPVEYNFENIPENILRQIAGNGNVEIDEKGKLRKVFLYNDGTNPANTDKIDEKERLYRIYDQKYELLLKFQRE